MARNITWKNNGNTTGVYIDFQRSINGGSWITEQQVAAGTSGQFQSVTLQDIVTLSGDNQPASGHYKYRMVRNSTTAEIMDCYPMDVPQLSISSLTSSYIGLAWSFGTASGDQNKFEYRLERSLNNSSWTLISTIQTNKNYVDNNVESGIQYYYRVTARHIESGTLSVVSNTVTTTPPTIGGVVSTNIGEVLYTPSMYVDTKCRLSIAGVFSSNLTLNLPTDEYGNTDVQTVSSIVLKTSNTCCEDATEYSFNIDLSGNSTSEYNLDFDGNIIINKNMFGLSTELDPDLDDGVYSFTLETTYTDTQGVQKTIVEPFCGFLNCTLKCQLASFVQTQYKNGNLALAAEVVAMYEALEAAITCDSCCNACKLFEELNNIVNGDGCC